jgi:hypothetical protein
LFDKALHGIQAMKTTILNLAVLLLAPLAALQAAEPAFKIRGTLPWHNFLSGPSAWNESDYRRYLDDLAARHRTLSL